MTTQTSNSLVTLAERAWAARKLWLDTCDKDMNDHDDLADSFYALEGEVLQGEARNGQELTAQLQYFIDRMVASEDMEDFHLDFLRNLAKGIKRLNASN